jgi:MFS family permease
VLSGLALAALIAADRTFELRPVHSEGAPTRVLHAVRDGLAAIWRIVPLRWNTVIDCIYVLAWGTLFVGFPAYAVSVGAGAHASGYMWAAISAGSMIGGFAPGRGATGRTPRLLLGGCLLAMALSAGSWPLAASLPVALVLVFVTGMLDGPALVALISIRQRIAPAHLRAQIFTTAASLHAAVFAAGPAAAGLINRAFGTTATLLTFAALIAGAGVLALRTETDVAQGACADATALDQIAVP